MTKARISDVAKLAGVSPSTVTRVIHENGYVSTENRMKVLSAVETLGYFPNLQARSLRNQRSYTIGLLLSSERTNPFYTNIAHAIRVVTADQGYSILSTNHSFSLKAERNAIRLFIEYDVEAAIICHALDPNNMAPLKRARIPIVQVERDRIEDTHLIDVDLRPGFDDSIKVLMSLGHRRIAFIGWKPLTDYRGAKAAITERRRAEGFSQAIERQGLNVDHCPLLLGDANAGVGPFDAGRTLADVLLDREGSRVSAIMTGSDVLAAGVLQALHARRIRVPDEMSVIGYDDSLAAYLTPPLTSVAQPYDAIANAALEIIKRCSLEPDDAPPIKVSVANQLVHRESIARCQP
ncbi:LacI family DNA-binding transcriptional regulator [Mesorhizobium sp. YR577]|uniref:LacI family DNA-binding transcriptional regulator n=1 Tax=Mesorhizobium sp. YR577 TaxID=1884373 RepID=UPI0015872DCE|nr:LacI family DNA-binding transcriptional regulator [Mesorhizobium sp. YR577]